MNGTCDTGVCAGVIAFGPPTGDVNGLGYCATCVPGTQATAVDVLEDEDCDDLVDDLLYEDGLA